MPSLLECDSLTCRRPQWINGGASQVDEVSMGFETGTLTGFHGQDGCGKGLLLNILGLLEAPDSGDILIQGQSTVAMREEDRRQLRNEAFGFLFDHPCLLPSFSVAENVAMPLFRICGGDARTARQRTMETLDFCGITHLEGTLVGRLDASDQRRTSLARALVHHPDILIAVSPRPSDALLPLLRRATKELGICALWAGKEAEILPYADRMVEMREGRVWPAL